MEGVEHKKTWRPDVADGCDWYGCVRLSPDGESIAYAQRAGSRSWLTVGTATGERREVASFEDGLAVEDIRWAPGQKRLAVLLAEDDSAYCKRVAVVCELGPTDTQWPEQMTATSCAWHPDGTRLAVYEAYSHSAVLYGSGVRVDLLGRGRDAGERAYPPQIAFSPDGNHALLALRSVFDDRMTVSVCSAKDGGYEQRLLTEIPGHEVYLRPFWSRRGRSVGILMCDVSEEQSAILLFRGASGGGKLVYCEERVDAPFTPVWTHDTKQVLWFQSQLSEGFPTALSCLQVETGQVRQVLDTNQAVGDLWLRTDTELIADGQDAAYIMELKC